MFTITKRGGDGKPSNYMEFMCDSVSDLENLPPLGFNGCVASSKAFIMETQKTYIIDNSGEWNELTISGSGSGGGISEDYIASVDETKNYLNI